MSERRISGWFVLSGIFIVAVFGLFFTFTERKTWPEKKIELSASDMRLVPTFSTMWCEAISLHSSHPFVAYHVSETPIINPKMLFTQQMRMNIKSRTGNVIQLKYFLLPFSVLRVLACSQFPGSHMFILKGDHEMDNFIQHVIDFENQDASYDNDDSVSIEDSSEEVQRIDLESSLADSTRHWEVEKCVDELSSSDKDLFSNQLALRFNISAADFYAIAVVNSNRFMNNQVKLRVYLERSRYDIYKTGPTFNMCSLAVGCTITLSFGSNDRALVSIPEESDAGKTVFTVRARCKPRLAVFAILSVFLPLLLFLIIAFVVRADKDKVLWRFPTRNSRREFANHNIQRTVPLLSETQRTCSENILQRTESGADSVDQLQEERPPDYNVLYDPPPPYSSVKTDEDSRK